MYVSYYAQIRKEVPMKRRTFSNKWKNCLAALLVPVLLAGTLVAPILQLTELFASAKTKNPYSIRELEGVSFDYQKYLNNSVMFPLPAGIKNSEEISVIVTVDCRYSPFTVRFTSSVLPVWWAKAD